MAGFSVMLAGRKPGAEGALGTALRMTLNLTDQVNRTRGELDDAYRERNEWEEQLLAADTEVQRLRAQLSELETRKPEAPAGWTPVAGGGMITIENSVLFAPGRPTLRQQARRALDAVASTLEGEYGDKDILVFGHTDDQPIKKSGWQDNWQLSTERSLAVVRYLRDRGVSPTRLVGCGCGEHRPRVANSSDSNRAANRRVEIYAIDPAMLNTR